MKTSQKSDNVQLLELSRFRSVPTIWRIFFLCDISGGKFRRTVGNNKKASNTNKADAKAIFVRENTTVISFSLEIMKIPFLFYLENRLSLLANYGDYFLTDYGSCKLFCFFPT